VHLDRQHCSGMTTAEQEKLCDYADVTDVFDESIDANRAISPTTEKCSLGGTAVVKWRFIASYSCGVICGQLPARLKIRT